MDPTDLRHHLIIHMQTAGGINDHHIDSLRSCMGDSVACDRQSFVSITKIGNTDLLSQFAQLFHSRRSVNIDAAKEYILVLSIFKQTCQLGGSRRFTCSLKPRHKHHRGWTN